MRKVLMIMAVLFFASSVTVFAGEGPMQLPSGANADANKHNEGGIAAWDKHDFEGALKHFSMAAKIDGSIGESHFNVAICLDKLGKHGDATMHFKGAKANAHGNAKILNSPILNGHIG